VILPGLVALALLLISAEAIGSHIGALYAFYFALGVAAPATTTVPYALVVSRWFDRRRGLAIGLMMVGLGVGAMAVPPVAQRLISAFGWRSALAIVGGTILLVAVPIVGLLLRDRPADMGLRPDGDSPSGQGMAAAAIDGVSWADSYRSRTFWVMVTAFVLLAASVHGCVVHMPELFADRGASAASAAAASSVVGAALLLGRIGSGYFLDRYFGPSVALFVCGGAATGMTLLLSGTTGPLALAGAFLVGLGMGAEVDIMAFLMGRYFGLRSLGSTFGFAFGAFVIAGGLGPLAMGFAFDLTGSYRLPLAGFLVATLAAGALVTRLGPYRFEVTNRPSLGDPRPVGAHV
jgi:cyanate permease